MTDADPTTCGVPQVPVRRDQEGEVAAGEPVEESPRFPRRLTGENHLARRRSQSTHTPFTVLANVASEALHRDDVPALDEEHLVALERRIDADLALGATSGLVLELRSLAKRHPLREVFWRQLMLALYESEQQAEALATFHQVREVLRDELGVDPGPRLTDVHEQILRGDVAVARRRDVPRQLPDHGRHFVGRTAELSKMDGRHPLVVLHGTGGVGRRRSRWARDARDQYPDGDLYLNLRGFDPEADPVAPESAAESLLLVLGNAANSSQVVPLLPGVPGVTVLITSRNQLRGLSSRHDPHRIPLRQLDLGAAGELLAAVLGDARVASEPEAVRTISTGAVGSRWRCACSPRRRTGSRRPHWPSSPPSSATNGRSSTR